MPYTFSVVKGQQNNTVFYQTNLEYGEIDSLVKLPKDLVADHLLDSETEMQRKLNTGTLKDMVEYLKKDDAFYSALTLFIVPRTLQEIVEGEEGYEFKPFEDKPKLGRLTIYSSCFLFTADGQHRAASIKQALREKPSIASYSIPVVLLPFKSKSQVKQFFSDLNLNAKPVNKSIGISFETRNPLAVITKEVEQLVPLFKDRVNHINNSLPASSKQVITLNVFYNCNEKLIKALSIKESELENNEYEIQKAVKQITEVWNVIIDSTPVWIDFQNKTIASSNGKQVSEENPKKGKKRSISDAGLVREKYLCSWAIGWEAIAQAVSVILKTPSETWESQEWQSQQWQSIVKQVMQSTDWGKSNPDWQNICLTGDKIQNTESNRKAVVGYIFERAALKGSSVITYLEELEKVRQSRNHQSF